MATPQDAIDYAKRMVGRLPIDDASLLYRVLNDAHSRLWMAAPWRWTVAHVDPITMVDNQTDYNLTSISDLHSLVKVTVENGETPFDLKIVGSLPANVTSESSQPSQAAIVEGSPKKLRIAPVPVVGASAPKLVPLYKKTLTEIVSGNASTEFLTLTGTPNEWFWVFQELVLLKAYQFTNNPRAGNVQVANGQVVYNGQHGVAAAAIEEMKRVERKYWDALGLEVQA